jgi:hypothetical protein
MKPINPSHLPSPALSGRRLGLAAVWAASMAAAVAAGWVARGPADAAPALPATPTATAQALAGATAQHAPLIAVADDGRVTLRLEQQPLDWVLEQIALQSGRADVAVLRARMAAAAATPAASAADPGERVEAADAACPPAAEAADPAGLLQAIHYGPEADRAEALLRARSQGIPVPETLLRTLLETAVPEQLRVAALEVWLDRRIDDSAAQRALLEAALLIPSPLVQQEARQRLDDLDEMARLDALPDQASP